MDVIHAHFQKKFYSTRFCYHKKMEKWKFACNAWPSWLTERFFFWLLFDYCIEARHRNKKTWWDIFFFTGVSCPRLVAPENGEMSALGFSYKDEATFSCLDGYIMNGTSSVTCQSDGEWDGKPPLCERKVLVIFLIVNQGLGCGYELKYCCEQRFVIVNDK